MTINNNLMNPVPLWTSKNDWYCKKATNHGNCVHPVVPNGMMPKMALTVVWSMSSSTTVQITQNSGMPNIYLRYYEGSVPGNLSSGITLTGLANFGEYPVPNPMPTITLTKIDGGFSVKVGGNNVSLYDNETEVSIIPKRVLEDGGHHIYCITYSGTRRTFKMSSFDFVVHTQRTISVSLKKVPDDSTVATQSFAGEIEGAGEYANNNMSGSMFLGGTNFTGTFADGVYYIQFTVDGTTYYSEPFMWLTNLNQYLHVVYRRSTPVVTTDNCIVFEYNGTARSLEAWLPGLLMMPPFTFNDEVDEIDGRKFVRKQVSYKDEKCEFMCTAYFAEAIRLLWHCDIRTAGVMKVEYMVRPEIDWNTDNHLCSAKLEFQGDTVMQTNGTASAYGDSSDSSHQSYDSSFDASFN